MPLGAEAKSRHMGSLKIIAGHLKEGSEHNRLRVTLAITDHQPAPTEEVLGHDSIWNISVVRRTSKCRSNGAGVNAFSLCATWSFIYLFFFPFKVTQSEAAPRPKCDNRFWQSIKWGGGFGRAPSAERRRRSAREPQRRTPGRLGGISAFHFTAVRSQ